VIGYLSRSEVIAYAPCRSDIRRPVSLSSLLDRGYMRVPYSMGGDIIFAGSAETVNIKNECDTSIRTWISVS